VVAIVPALAAVAAVAFPSGGTVVAQNRSERQSQALQNQVVIETLRQGSESPKAAEPEPKDEHRMPVFWRVFGGTVLSITSLIVMTAYQGFTAGLAELRSDLGHLQTECRKEVARLCEAQADLIGKEELATKLKQLDRNLVDLDEDSKSLKKLKERCEALLTAYRAGVEQRRELESELRLLREQNAAQREREELRNELTRLRERLAGLEAGRARSQPVSERPGT
jgi:hypothetical protein